MLPTVAAVRPAHTRVHFDRSATQLRIQAQAESTSYIITAIIVLIMALPAWVLYKITKEIVTGLINGEILLAAAPGMASPLLCIWVLGLCVACDVLKGTLLDCHRLTISAHAWSLERHSTLLDCCWRMGRHLHAQQPLRPPGLGITAGKGLTDDLESATLSETGVLTLLEGINRHGFVAPLLLTTEEKHWIAWEINDFLAQAKAQRDPQGHVKLQQPRKPAGSCVQLERTPSHLDVMMVRRGFVELTGGLLVTCMFAFPLAYVGSFAMLQGMLLVMRQGSWFTLISGALFTAPVYAWFIWTAARVCSYERFAASASASPSSSSPSSSSGIERWRLAWEYWWQPARGCAVTQFLSVSQNCPGEWEAVADLRGARVCTEEIVDGKPRTHVEVFYSDEQANAKADDAMKCDMKRRTFGHQLHAAEQEWIAHEINAFISDAKGIEVDLAALPPPQTPRVTTTHSSTSD